MQLFSTIGKIGMIPLDNDIAVQDDGFWRFKHGTNRCKKIIIKPTDVLPCAPEMKPCALDILTPSYSIFDTHNYRTY